MNNIQRRIPKGVNNLYANLGIKTKFYINLRWILSHFEEIEERIPPEGCVLDAGCGYGLLANLIALKSKKRNVSGVDSSHKRISIAKQSIKNRKNINFLESDLRKIEFASYGAITFSDVLHHFPYNFQEELLTKIFKQIKQGEIILIKELDTHPILKYYLSYVIDKTLNLGRSIFYRSIDQWIHILKKIGFDLEIIPLQKSTILSSILYVCRKQET